MLLTKRDSAGRIQGCLEAHPVNYLGQVQPTGPYLWIEQLEISSDCNIHEVLPHLIMDLDRLLPLIHTVYWIRRDSTGQKLHRYSRKRAILWAKKEQMACSS